MVNRKKAASTCSVIAAGALWGSMGIFVRRLNAAGLASFDIVELRALVTSIVLFLGLGIFRRELLRIKLRDIWCFLGTGIGSIVFFNYCYFKTIVISSLSIAAILLYTAPAMVMIMSFFLFKERMTVRKILAVILAFIGCVCVSGINAEDKISAECLVTGLGAGFGYALYSIFSRFAIRKGYSSATISSYTFLFAAIGALPLADVSCVTKAFMTDKGIIIFAIIFGVITTVAPYALYTWGLKYMENGRASVLASVEPVVATLIGLAAFNESITLSAGMGIILVLLSIVLCSDEKI